MGVRFDDGGVTVRNFWRTRKISWDQLLGLTDGGNDKGAWALKVVCRDGRDVPHRPGSHVELALLSLTLAVAIRAAHGLHPVSLPGPGRPGQGQLPGQARPGR